MTKKKYEEIARTAEYNEKRIALLKKIMNFLYSACSGVPDIRKLYEKLNIEILLMDTLEDAVIYSTILNDFARQKSGDDYFEVLKVHLDVNAPEEETPLFNLVGELAYLNRTELENIEELLKENAHYLTMDDVSLPELKDRLMEHEGMKSYEDILVWCLKYCVFFIDNNLLDWYEDLYDDELYVERVEKVLLEKRDKELVDNALSDVYRTHYYSLKELPNREYILNEDGCLRKNDHILGFEEEKNRLRADAVAWTYLNKENFRKLVDTISNEYGNETALCDICNQFGFSLSDNHFTKPERPDISTINNVDNMQETGATQ